MSAVDLFFSFLLTLALHATVLLGAAWLLERAGALKHPGWAELAWRIALFGALLSSSLEFLPSPGDLSPSPRAAMLAPLTTPAPAMVEAPQAAFDSGTRDPAAAPRPSTPPTLIARETMPLPASGARLPTDVEVPDAAAWGLLACWLAGLLWGAVRLLAQAIAVRRLGRTAEQHGAIPGPGLSGAARLLANELAIAPPTLRLLPQLQSPMVLPGANVLLPSWSQTLPPTQQRAMLAHELSHLQRRDPAWRIAQRIAALPLFFHPLARHAQRRLDALAEDACDARAAQLLGSGRPLAECLATCLSHAGARAGQPALAVAMAGEPGAVVRRVSNLLENTAMTLRPLSPGVRRTALVLAIIAIVALPGVAITTVASQGFADRILTRLDINGRENFSYRSRGPERSVDLRLSGEITFNDGETDVVRLGKGARLDLVEEREGVERELEVFGKDGVIQRAYRVDGKAMPLDADGRAWLARTLPELIRESAINAESRGKRILAKGGADALLADMALIQADYAKSRYLGVLYANAKLDDAQLARSLDLAKGIDSDFELRQALQVALDSQTLSPDHQARVLGLASEIGSDFEVAELLISVASRLPATGVAREAWQSAIANISSDFEHRRVLEAMLTRRDVTPATVELVLDSAEGISSDFELRNVLERAARHTRGNPAVLAAYVARSRELSSDFEAREALSALVNAGPVDLAVANAVLDVVAGISSDFEAGEALRTLASRMPADEALVNRYRAAARGLGDHERGQAEKALDRFAVVD
ncbi:MAG: M56 family metallopeptidase [Arenimonas sp.]|nr:M56 family metallopeptidase [Arenimonas sp.]